MTFFLWFLPLDGGGCRWGERKEQPPNVEKNFKSKEEYGSKRRSE